MRGRGRRALTERQPHPDPMVEAKLQRILALQDQVRVRLALAEDYRAEIASLHAAARTALWHNESQEAQLAYGRANELHVKIVQLDRGLDAIHDKVLAALGELDDTEAAYLAPVRREE